jgi:hypothetical protein
MSPVHKGFGYGIALFVFILVMVIVEGFKINGTVILLSLIFPAILGIGVWHDASKNK